LQGGNPLFLEKAAPRDKPAARERPIARERSAASDGAAPREKSFEKPEREFRERPEREPRERKPARERAERNNEEFPVDESGEKSARPRRTFSPDMLGPPEEGMERYRIEVGHQHEVKPGNIVGAIANEADIESKFIGKIEIFDDFSLVDLPEGMPSEVFDHLKKVWVAKRMMNISRYEGATSGSKRSFDKKPGKTSGKQGFEKKTSEKKPFEKKSFEKKKFEKSFDKKPGDFKKKGKPRSAD
jgi:ATP-dependent RNA helicase DeaD